MKVLVGVDKGSYSFDASAQTVTITGFGTPLDIEQVLLIIHLPSNEAIYSPLSCGGYGGTMAGTVLTLDYDTTLLSDTDELQVWFSDPAYEQPVTGTFDADIDLPLDAFSRLRVSDPTTVFDSKMVLDELPVIWETTTAGGGSTLYLGNESAVQLSTGTASGDKAVRESHGYVMYSPGKSQLGIFTGVLGTRTTNTVKRVGLFNDDDGLFYEQDGTTERVVIRSSASGSVVDTQFDRSTWDDPLDGTGISGLNINFENSTIIMGVDYEWLGVGRVRFFIFYGGKPVVLKTFDGNDGSLDRVYMQRPDLPVRYEIENTGISTGGALKQICTSIQSEGGLSETAGFVYGYENETALKTISPSTLDSILGLRLSTTFNGKTNRMRLKLLNISIRSTSDLFLKVFVSHAHLGQATTTGANWTDISTGNSGVQYSTDISTFTNTDKILFSDFVVGANKGQSSVVQELKEKYVTALNAAGTASDVIHICGRSFSGNSSVSVTCSWREVY